MPDTHAHLDGLGGLAAKLRNGATDLDGAATPPPAPQAGECTQAIAAAMALLTMSAAEVVEIMDGMGTAVAEGKDVYGDVDAGIIEDMSHIQIKPEGN